jgi:hypothetical protein
MLKSTLIIHKSLLVYVSTTKEKMLKSAWQIDILHNPLNSNSGSYA